MIKIIGENYRIYGLIIVKTVKTLLVLDMDFQMPLLRHLTMFFPCKEMSLNLLSLLFIFNTCMKVCPIEFWISIYKLCLVWTCMCTK
jgi:hypothetical protein